MNMKRMRGRNHRSGGGGGGGGGGGSRHQSGNIPLNRNHVFDSNGPDLRVRGTAQQLFEKYLQLGRDASSSGDRVMAESYFQYAEHYFRILGAMQAAQQQNAPHQPHNGYQGQPRRYQQDGESSTEENTATAETNAQLAGMGEQPGVDNLQTEEAPPAEASGREPRHDGRRERRERPVRGERRERGERAERAEIAPQAEGRPPFQETHEAPITAAPEM